jgi:hypothetical protein
MRHVVGLCAVILMLFAAPLPHAGELPGLDVAVDVRHAGKDVWRVDYRFAQPVTEIKLPAVGEYRRQAWKVLTPGLSLEAGPEFDVISSKGKPFKTASVEIATYTALSPKAYASFNRFSDGGTAVYLGHLQGDVAQGKNTFEMRTDIRLFGMPQENVIAPPRNRLLPGGDRGYAYFGPAQPIAAGKAQILMDPTTPEWARETLLDVGARISQYYEQAYQRALKDDLLVMVSVEGFDTPGFSVKGGAVLGQLSYRLAGAKLLGDHPKKREVLSQLVAHEMAHLWQFNIARGGVGEADPWIHEGGAEAMALDGLQQTGVWREESVNAYRKTKAETCEKLGDSVESYDGIYACGLVRFDRLGVGIVPLWRSMMQATEVKGEHYSRQMIDAIVAGK